MNIAIVQPAVPTYREQFFRELQNLCKLDIFVYKSPKDVSVKLCDYPVTKIALLKIGPLELYDPIKFFVSNYDVIVLPLQISHPILFLLLLSKWLHRKKIVLWGHGISVKRYLKETIHPDWKLKNLISLSDGVWIYQEPEANQWKKIFPNKPIVALYNTISNVETILSVNYNKSLLKKKYGISQKTILIFCARFESNYRRCDLLLKTIQKIDSNLFGFIIIGAGKNKPDFSIYKNVYDFGAVYDRELKDELFSLADIYFQPGWVGLSIVEAMAYGKPVCTFIRSEETLQCVEYSYIEDGKNGYVFQNIDDCFNKLQNTSIHDFIKMGDNARQLVRDSLTPDKMAANAFSVLSKLHR